VLYKKNNKRMTRLVALTLVTALIGALSVFVLFKWTQKPVVEPKPATTSQALTILPDTKLTEQAVTLPAADPTDLETLVAPIALYPDLLLAQLLPASTYPLEVVQAARWLESKPDLTQAGRKNWAPGITALLQFPQVIFMMNDRFDWIAKLGDRFLAQPDSVLAAIQAMRARAMMAGLLKDSPEQKVTKVTVTKIAMGKQQDQGTWVKVPAASKVAQTRQTEVIRIEPANPQVIYVPQYNPQVLYTDLPAPAYYPGASPTPDYYGTTSSQASPRLTYGVGVATGALLGWAISEWSDDVWDDHYHGYYRQPYIAHYSENYNCYRGEANSIDIYRDVIISGNEDNVDRKNTLHQPVPTPWVHDPLHRHGYPYPPQAQQHLATPKQQPALAGQRRAPGQAVNPDYTGYELDKLDRMRQTQVEKVIGQGIASTRKQQDEAVQEEVTEQGSPQAKEIPYSAPTSDPTVAMTNFTDRSSETNSVFSDVVAGSQAQIFSKRGQASRTGGTHDKRRKQ
jgi:hypothetical protein